MGVIAGYRANNSTVGYTRTYIWVSPASSLTVVTGNNDSYLRDSIVFTSFSNYVFSWYCTG